MTPCPVRQALREGIVAGLATHLGLKDWTFTVQDIDPESGYEATCAILVGRKHAVLSFPAEWDWSLTPAQFHTVIHELLHCHFDQYKIVINRLSGILAENELQLLDLAMRDVIEYGIDAVAGSLCTLMGTPE